MTMKRWMKMVLGLGAVGLCVMACNLPSGGEQPGSDAQPSSVVEDAVEATVSAEQTRLAMPTFTVTAEPGLETPTPSLAQTLENTAAPTQAVEASATLQPSATPTVTMAVSPTPSGPVVSVSMDTNCRLGPHVVYDYQGALLKGETAAVVGRIASNAWVLIENPDRDGSCWITMSYGTVQGDLAGAPVVVTPPFYDWNGTYSVWANGLASIYPMTLSQNGVNVSGSLVVGGSTLTISGSLSQNGQVFSGTLADATAGTNVPLSFKMLENMKQVVGNYIETTTKEICGARESSGKPAPCLWP